MHSKCDYALLLMSGILLHHIKSLSSASPLSMEVGCSKIMTKYGNNENTDNVAALKNCEEDSFECADGNCIGSSSLCDGIADCAGEVDDERKCERCPEGSYKCDNGSCIDETLICDGKKDCGEQGDDEEDCDKVNLCAKTKAKCSCIGDSIVCSGKGLISLPNKINKVIINFDFKNNKLGLFGNFSNSTFSRYNQLGKLYLDHNNITQLPSRVFQNLEALTTLGLSHNQMEFLDEDIFKNLRELDNLNLESNRITKLSVEVFSNLNKLTNLSLSSNKISIIEDFTFSNLTELRTLDITQNKVSTLTSNMFKNLEKLETLRLGSNNIITIESWTFNGLPNLQFVNLGVNNIQNLTADIFKEMKNLRRLVLHTNKISVIESSTFNNNIRLEDLDLRYNKISTLTSYLFHKMTEVRYLRLNDNEISNIEDYAFSGLVKLQTLYLNSNRIKNLPSHMFQTTSDLKVLILRDNEITSIENSTFDKLKNLRKLNLNSNRMSTLDSHLFEGLNNLRELYLRNNTITTLERFSFHGLRSLITLDLQHNQIKDVDENIFHDVISLKHLITDEYRFCCMKKELSTCIPSPNEFSSCDDLMTNTFLRISIWVLGIIAISANLFVLIFRRGEQNSHLNQKNSFLIKNLAVSDLFMGIYLLIIAFADFFYRGKYYQHDFEWRTSLLCNFAGFMSTFSSELTVFTLTVIAIERLILIAFPLRIQRPGRINRTRNLMLIVWILAAILSLVPLPLFNIDYFENFYGRSGVCLPLHITNEKANGWEYSVFIFIILNGISFTVIALSYISMYWLVKRASEAVGLPISSSHPSMAIRMMILVLADAACWIPIITLGIRSLMGYTITPNVYAWIAVFVLPLNAALNPILYTISTMPLVIKFQTKNKLFKGQLGLRWPCYWKKSDNTNKISSEVRRIVSQ